ncbi:uncharacterized protein LOC115598756 [Calypte anna]|uniref:uncharacterized protein LOC115598756 n=1 Tax=Calypte anna TaxID=9244 RepID=UPI0011C486A2|nr:uncharacterized protein LOC115598756 [Calypte anna]
MNRKKPTEEERKPPPKEGGSGERSGIRTPQVAVAKCPPNLILAPQRDGRHMCERLRCCACHFWNQMSIEGATHCLGATKPCAEEQLGKIPCDKDVDERAGGEKSAIQRCPPNLLLAPHKDGRQQMGERLRCHNHPWRDKDTHLGAVGEGAVRATFGTGSALKLSRVGGEGFMGLVTSDQQNRNSFSWCFRCPKQWWQWRSTLEREGAWYTTGLP